MPSPNPDLLTLLEAAALLRVSRSTAYALYQRGLLKGPRRLRPLRVYRSSVEKLLSEPSGPAAPRTRKRRAGEGEAYVMKHLEDTRE